LKDTVTLVLRQPFALAGGPALAEAAGGVASRLIVTDAVDVPPPLVAEHVTATPDVSFVTFVGPQPVLDEIADSPSVTVHVTDTLPMYQPAFPSWPVTVGVITGGVESAAVHRVARSSVFDQLPPTICPLSLIDCAYEFEKPGRTPRSTIPPAAVQEKA